MPTRVTATPPVLELLGSVGDTPVHIDGEQDRRWQRPELVIDVSPGAAMGFSLEGVESVHLLARTA
jgi:uncharacterized protein (DUF779 family)